VDSLDGEDDVPDAEVGLLVVDPDEVVVLLLNEQPDISSPATSTVATSHRRVIPASYIVDLSAEKGRARP